MTKEILTARAETIWYEQWVVKRLWSVAGTVHTCLAIQADGPNGWSMHVDPKEADDLFGLRWHLVDLDRHTAWQWLRVMGAGVE